MATIADVARAAGVSIATVSRVLSPGPVPHPVRADTADRYGNLTYRYAQMNFGLAMATAAATVVAEVRIAVDEPVPFERVGCPGIYVDRVVVAKG